MTFIEFMSILNGEYKEIAGTTARNQCVDLANAYIKYVLGLPIIEWTNAVDFPSKAGDNYEYILNTPEGVPQEGDLVIWSGRWGHIAIFIEGDVNRFTSFDQNYPVGSPCHVQEHNYNNILGWLRPKFFAPSNNTGIYTDQTKIDLGTYGVLEVQALRGKMGDLVRLEEAVKNRDQTINELTQEIEEAHTAYDRLKKDLSGYQSPSAWVTPQTPYNAPGTVEAPQPLLQRILQGLKELLYD